MRATYEEVSTKRVNLFNPSSHKSTCVDALACDSLE